MRVGGAHLPPVALWVTGQLYKHFPPLVTRLELRVGARWRESAFIPSHEALIILK